MKYLLLFLIATSAWAHTLYLDPHAGFSVYSKSGFGQKENSPGGITGIRLGYKYDNFFTVYEYQYLRLDRTASDEPVSGNEHALLFGINFPISFRAWVGAIIGGSYKAQSIGQNGGAHGFKVGVGYRFYEYWNLNFEIREAKYDTSRGTPDFADFKAWGAAMTISWPFEYEFKKVRRFSDI
jgi:hypothetical protein